MGFIRKAEKFIGGKMRYWVISYDGEVVGVSTNSGFVKRLRTMLTRNQWPAGMNIEEVGEVVWEDLDNFFIEDDPGKWKKNVLHKPQR